MAQLFARQEAAAPNAACLAGSWDEDRALLRHPEAPVAADGSLGCVGSKAPLHALCSPGCQDLSPEHMEAVWELNAKAPLEQPREEHVWHRCWGAARGARSSSGLPGAVADPWAFPMLFPSLVSASCRSCSSHSLGTPPRHCPHCTDPCHLQHPSGQSHGPAEQSRAALAGMGLGGERGLRASDGRSREPRPRTPRSCPSKSMPVWPHLAPGCTGSRVLMPMALSILELGGQRPKWGSAGRSSAPRPGLSH